jgi:cell division protein FtsN
VLTRAFSSLVGIAVIASRIACVIVIAWFVVFAVDQTKTASSHQQKEVPGSAQSEPAPSHRRSAATKTLDEAAGFLTTPFRAATSKSSSAWLIHGLDTLLVLLVYGLAVGFVARMIRVRV